jgi:hypothetical protein
MMVLQLVGLTLGLIPYVVKICLLALQVPFRHGNSSGWSAEY